jgi:hemerythrin
MSLLTWDAAYSLNVAEIDRQHQRLFALFNALYEAMQQGRAPEAIGKVLDAVVDYTHYHFAFEEQYLREHGYADSEAHRAEHRRLSEQARELARRAREGDVTPATLKFLSGWLLGHILVSDRKFARELEGMAPGGDAGVPAATRPAERGVPIGR